MSCVGEKAGPAFLDGEFTWESGETLVENVTRFC